VAKIVIELTDRCNLRCQHCFSGRHGGWNDLPLDVLRHILTEAKGSGFDQLSFTGGEPTIHPHFLEILKLAVEAGYTFGFNSNGWNFSTLYPHLHPYQAQLSIITFSLDGARETSHDRLRGKGSYRRVRQAISICLVTEIPFTLNMVVTRHNRHEIALMAELASRAGSRGLRFGHLMPAPLTSRQGFDLSAWERKVVEAEIRALSRAYPIPIALAPGFHTTDLFPCGPLQLQEINIDCRGNLTKCCHLSGHGSGVGQADLMGNLKQVTFGEAYRRLRRENEQFRQFKLGHLAGGAFQDSDFFPCWYCSQYYQKVDWLRGVPDHPWLELIWERQPQEEERW
jgi:MoaA/NifB/PqqE/SkfB family radical SAM enzyme